MSPAMYIVGLNLGFNVWLDSVSFDFMLVILFKGFNQVPIRKVTGFYRQTNILEQIFL